MAQELRKQRIIIAITELGLALKADRDGIVRDDDKLLILDVLRIIYKDLVKKDVGDDG